jgi:hypothetical protein
VSDISANTDYLLHLADEVCDENASADDLSQLDTILFADNVSRRCYLKYCQMHAALGLELRAQHAVQRLCRQIDSESVATGPRSTSCVAIPLPSVVPASSPAPAFVSTTLHSTLGFFSSGWPLAYLIATVVVSIGLWVSSVTPAFYPQQIAKRSSSTRGIESAPEPHTEFVGQITGMADCRWARGTISLLVNDAVPVGREVRLQSGLMEITYNTGAKVVLQGPATYEVESAKGGYLSLGRLTAKVEKDSRSKVQDSRVAKTAGNSNPQSPIPDPSSLSTYSLFTIKTPTATVTDLGTEFGVEVDKQGATTSHVFRGSVKVQAIAADGQAKGDGRILRENESARVEQRPATRAGGPQIVVTRLSTPPMDFIREIPKHTIKVLDLADVVAGGDGYSRRRGRGIHPVSGQLVDSPLPSGFGGDGRYHRVGSLPFVDGVFIPDGSRGPVQIDSTGRTFDEFGPTSNRTAYSVWPGGGIPSGDPGQLVSTELAGVDYASPGHGLLLLNANKGITFDLDAVRRANPGCKIVRFLAMTGNTENSERQGAKMRDAVLTADLWILVDGQVRFRRREINGYSGGVPAKISIGNHDRFLTLVGTEGGNGTYYDWIIFGDPRLELERLAKPSSANNVAK